MIGHLIWYDIDKDIGNNLQNEWRLWIMNLEFWILDGIQTLRTPAGDVLMPFITSFGNGGVIWIVLTVILLLIPKTRKTGLILGAALILDGILCNLLLKNLVRRIRPCDIKDAVRLLIPYPSDYSFPSGHTAVSFAAASALYFAGEKVLVEGSTGFGSLHRIFQNVFVCTLSNRYSGWSASGNPVRISRMSDRAENRTI